MASIAAAAGMAAHVAAAAPRLVCEQPAHDFGCVTPDRVDLAHTFELRNEGDEPVEILSVASGCGCLAAEPAHHIIPPGAATKLTVRLNPAGRRGPLTREVVVHTTDPRQRALHLSVRADIQAMWGVEPTAAMFGHLALDQTATQQLRLSLARPDIRIRGATADAAWINAAVEGEGPERTLRIVARPPYPPGPWLIGRVMVESPDLSPPPAVAVTAVRQAPLFVLPETLVAQRGDSGASPRYLLVQGSRVRETKIVGVESDRAAVTWQRRRLEDGAIQIAVRGLRGDPALDGATVFIRTEPSIGTPLSVVFRVAEPEPASPR